MLNKIKEFFKGTPPPDPKDLVGIRQALIARLSESLRTDSNLWVLVKSDSNSCIFRNFFSDVDLIWEKDPLRILARHKNEIGNPLDEVELPIAGYEYLLGIFHKMEEKGLANQSKYSNEKLDTVAYYLLKKMQ